MPSRIINFGSCCIDHVYAVPHFMQPGETLPAANYSVHPGGKGLNQSLAAAKAGATTLHAGRIGNEGAWLRQLLADNNVNTEFLLTDDTPTGHAVIQVVPSGENAIVIYGGANRCMTAADIENVFTAVTADDVLLLQNEINAMPEIIDAAKQRGLRIVFNAAPMTDDVLTYPLHHIDTFILNLGEAQALTGASDTTAILAAMKQKFPDAELVLTLGENGAVYQYGDIHLTQPASSVDAIDTTGAGDTFTGYYVAGMLNDADVRSRLQTACQAAAISVTRHGAASSIPARDELG